MHTAMIAAQGGLIVGSGRATSLGRAGRLTGLGAAPDRGPRRFSVWATESLPASSSTLDHGMASTSPLRKPNFSTKDGERFEATASGGFQHRLRLVGAE